MNTRQITAAAKNWLQSKGYNDVMIHHTRGIWHLTNGANYLLSAKEVLEAATGLKFDRMNSSMTRLA